MANHCGASLDRPTIEARLDEAIRREAELQRRPGRDEHGVDEHDLRSMRHQVGLYRALLARMDDPGAGDRHADPVAAPVARAGLPAPGRASGSDAVLKQTRVLVRLAQVIDSLSARALGLELALGRELQRALSPRPIEDALRTTYKSLASLRGRRAYLERELGLNADGGIVGTKPEALAP
jgi:hypothetical protein